MSTPQILDILSSHGYKITSLGHLDRLQGTPPPAKGVVRGTAPYYRVEKDGEVIRKKGNLIFLRDLARRAHTLVSPVGVGQG